MHRQLGIPIAISVASVLATAGCFSASGSSTTASDRQTRLTMNVLSIFYGEYLESHRGTPPKDSGEFRTYLESRSEDLLRYNVDDPELLMTSPRDGQPFVIVCRRRIAPKDSAGTPWAAYEQTGVEGQRMAVQVRGGVHDLTVDEIAETFSTE